VKLNETYLGHAPLNNGAVRRHVLCHELGHVFGLDHPDGSARTCMNDLVPLEEIPDDARYQHPDQHDYDQLVDIYQHVHASAGAAAAPSGSSDAGPVPAAEPVAGGPSVYQTDLGDGRRIVTFVHYVDDLTG
jgi:hypothetical protein